MTFLLFVATLYGFELTAIIDCVDWSIASTLYVGEREPGSLLINKIMQMCCRELITVIYYEYAVILNSTELIFYWINWVCGSCCINIFEITYWGFVCMMQIGGCAIGLLLAWVVR